MLPTLLRANSFSEAYIQGIITFLILGLFFLIGSAIYKSFSRKSEGLNKQTQPQKKQSELKAISPDKDVNEINTLQKTDETGEKNSVELWVYFFSYLNKGYRRLVFVGSFVLPLIFGIIFSYSWDSQEDDGHFVGGFLLAFFLYWVIFFVTVWILKGFKEDKKIS